MLTSITRGLVAGAAGTMALDMASYADMVLRGRPPSQVPAKVAKALLQNVGIELPDDGQGEQAQQAQARESGLGALFGYATGLGIGAAYGLVRPRLGRVATPLAGVALGLAAMAASDVPATTTGATDPRTWGASGWIADLIPHLIYGLVTASVYEAMGGTRPRR